MPKTPLQMLLRGQNLVGYRNYADDVVEAFVEHAARVRHRHLPRLRRPQRRRNFETAFKAIKESRQARPGRHQLLAHRARAWAGRSSTSTTTSTRPIALEEHGRRLHLHQGHGRADLARTTPTTLIKAPEEGAQDPDPAALPLHQRHGLHDLPQGDRSRRGHHRYLPGAFALRSSQPAIEPIVAALQGTERDTGLDLKQLLQDGRVLRERSRPSTATFSTTPRWRSSTPACSMHQIPGGMISNLVTQLREAGALDRLQRGLRGASAGPQGAGLPAAGDAHQPDCRHPGGAERAVRPLQDDLRPGQGLLLRPLRQAAGALDPEVQKLALKGYERGEEPYHLPRRRYAGAGAGEGREPTPRAWPRISAMCCSTLSTRPPACGS